MLRYQRQDENLLAVSYLFILCKSFIPKVPVICFVNLFREFISVWLHSFGHNCETIDKLLGSIP